MIDSLYASPDARHLTVQWECGARTELPAEYLRGAARDAGSMRERIDHGTVTVVPGITITGLVQVGPAGVNVHFSDGHARAIYPFTYLRELSDRFDK